MERAIRPAPPVQNVLLLCSCSSNDVHYATATASTELNRACLQGEQGVVATTADTGARVEVGAALADDDLACGNDLATEALYAEVLGVGVTTVASGARAFFMCHLKCLPLNSGESVENLNSNQWLLDTGDLDLGQFLTVTLALLVAGLVLELLDDDLRTTEVFEDLSRNLDLGQIRSSGGDLVTVHQEQCGQLKGAAGSTGDAVQGYVVSNGNLFLAAACADNRVHHLGTHFSRRFLQNLRAEPAEPCGPDSRCASTP
jgi:hypothetical protein